MASKEEIRRVSIYINGNEAELSLKQIEKGAAKLKNELGRLIPGTEEFKKKLLELRETRQVLQDVQDDIRGVGGAFGWLKTEIGKLGVLATGYLGFEFITDQFKNIISQNAKLADSIADVQKTTGMSGAEVRQLQKSFDSIDTRSSRAELTGLAEVAGKLGISGQKDVLGFVRAADQINVALGKDLGDAEAAVNDLGKLVDIFKIKDAYGLEQALLKTGSAVNDLGAAGTANEGYLVEFAKRLGGVAPAANMSIQNVLGLASVMDELGQPVEAAATAIGQFIIGMGDDIPRYAKIAGMSIDEFSKTLKNDGNAALTAVLKNLDSTGQGVQGLATSMGLIGEEGARAVAALGLLSNNIELLETRQKESNASFELGTSLTDEYNTKNNNFAATLDKLSKKFNALTSNSTVTGWLVAGTEAFGDFLDSVNKNINGIAAFVKMLVAGAAAYLAYNTAVKITTVAQRSWLTTLMASEAMVKLQMIAEAAWASLKLLLTGRIREARAAMVGFNAIVGMNPIGAMVAALTAAVTMMILFKDSTSDAAKAQVLLNKVHADGINRVADETDKLKLLNEVATDTNEKYENRIAAIKKLRELTPDHLRGYSDEEIMAGKANVAVKDYIATLEKRAEAEIAYEELKRLKAEERQLRSEDGQVNFMQGVGVVLTDIFAGSDAGSKFERESSKENKNKALSANLAKQQAIKDKYSTDIKQNAVNGNATGGGGFNDTLKITEMTVDQLAQKIEELKKRQAQLVRGTPEYEKITKELKAANAQMKLIKKDSGEGGDGPDLKKAKAAFLKKSSELSEIVKTFNADELARQASKNEKEIQDTENKYDRLINKEIAFQAEIKKSDILSKKEKQAEEKKHQDEIDKLRTDKNKAVNAIIGRQNEELLKQIRDFRTQMGEVNETELQKETDRINNFYDDQLANAAENSQVWAEIEEARAKDLADAKIREEQRFALEVEAIDADGAVTAAEKHKVKLARINRQFDEQVEALKKRYSKELQATKEFQDALAKIENNRKNAINQADAEGDQKMQQAIIQGAIQTAQTVANAAFDIKKQNRDAETQEELYNIDKQREKELSNKNLTEEQKKKINEKYDKQAAEVKLKAWEADKEANIQRAIINGALAVGMALATTPFPLSLIQAGVAAAAAGAEVAVIANTKPPKYEDGGYSSVDYKKPDGWVKSPTLFNNSASGRPFIAGEKYKSEYIISSEQLKDPVIADFVGAMEAKRMVGRFEAGGYSNATAKLVKPKHTSTSTESAGNHEKRITALEQTADKYLAMFEKQAAINEIPVTLNTTALDEHNRKNAQIKTQAGA